MKYLATYSFAFLLLCFCAPSVSAQNTVLGYWKTIDDETGKAKSIVEIYKKDGKVYGKIVKLFREPSEDQDPSCTKCSDDRKGQKVLGMQILRDMVYDSEEEWGDGTILDPKNGKIYTCAIWTEDGKKDTLYVRGYWGWFYRTQVWQRVSSY